MNLVSFLHEMLSNCIVGTLWAQLLLLICFEILQMFSAWIEDLHVVWVQHFIFSHFFCFVNLVSLFLHEMLSACIDSRYLVGATPLTIFLQLF